MKKVMLGVAVLALLSACGSTTEDRALSGAGIGAGIGAVGAAISGGSIAKGAVIGGAAGAVGGAVTKEEDVNLGRPAWRR